VAFARGLPIEADAGLHERAPALAVPKRAQFDAHQMIFALSASVVI